MKESNQSFGYAFLLTLTVILTIKMCVFNDFPEKVV